MCNELVERIEVLAADISDKPRLFILRFNGRATPGDFENAAHVVKRTLARFHAGHQIIVLGNDIDLSVVAEESLDEFCRLRDLKVQDDASGD